MKYHHTVKNSRPLRPLRSRAVVLAFDACFPHKIWDLFVKICPMCARWRDGAWGLAQPTMALPMGKTRAPPSDHRLSCLAPSQAFDLGPFFRKRPVHLCANALWLRDAPLARCFRRAQYWSNIAIRPRESAKARAHVIASAV